jgi:16S rRNA processing protein RimM
VASQGQVSAGRVGRAHGLDGSFYVDGSERELDEGAEVEIEGVTRVVERRGGTPDRPLLRLAGVSDRDSATALRGSQLLVAAEEADEDGDWLVSDLVGCRVTGMGTVARVIDAPSCDVLELEDGRLVPLISDAVRRVDVSAGVVEVDLAFLGEEES